MHPLNTCICVGIPDKRLVSSIAVGGDEGIAINPLDSSSSRSGGANHADVTITGPPLDVCCESRYFMLMLFTQLLQIMSHLGVSGGHLIFCAHSGGADTAPALRARAADGSSSPGAHMGGRDLPA